MTRLLCALAILLSTAAVAAPPSGRPPEGPLRRYEPHIWELEFQIQLATVLQRDMSEQEFFRIVDTPIVMPVIFQSTFSKVDPDSLHARLWLDGIEDRSLNSRTRLDDGYPFQTQLAVIPIPRFEGRTIRWMLGYLVQVWNSEINDELASRITWPREWPEEAQDGLAPQMYIQSDDPFFAEAVETITEGNLRLVPPYFAAKDIVRYCINNIRISGDGEERRNLGMLHGMRVSGALNAARRGLGSPHDLVCVCVATLRAAGIPARIVIGIEEDEDEDVPPTQPGQRRRSKEEFVTWGEFYLPDAGWIPFDPLVMGNRVRTLDVRQPWPGFGHLDELNQRVPLGFHFLPTASVEVPEFPAVWGWDPRPRRPGYGTEQVIDLDLTDRGRGIEDPR